jgi:hypothetical protein
MHHVVPVVAIFSVIRSTLLPSHFRYYSRLPQLQYDKLRLPSGTTRCHPSKQMPGRVDLMTPELKGVLRICTCDCPMAKTSGLSNQFIFAHVYSNIALIKARFNVISGRQSY